MSGSLQHQAGFMAPQEQCFLTRRNELSKPWKWATEMKETSVGDIFQDFWWGPETTDGPESHVIHSIYRWPSWMCKLCSITADRWLASKGILLKQLGRPRSMLGMSSVDPASTISRLRLSTIRSNLSSDVYTFQSPLIPKSSPLFPTYNTWLGTQGIPHGICLF